MTSFDRASDVLEMERWPARRAQEERWPAVVIAGNKIVVLPVLAPIVFILAAWLRRALA
jgi:hypothetical protein